MAQNINSVPKSNSKTVALAVIGWAIIGLAIVGGTGFYFGVKFEQNQTPPRRPPSKTP